MTGPEHLYRPAALRRHLAGKRIPDEPVRTAPRALVAALWLGTLALLLGLAAVLVAVGPSLARA